MDESIQVSTPTETAPPSAPVAEPAPVVEETRQPNVYGQVSGHAYDDPARALAGERQSQIREAQQAAQPDAKITEPPPGQKFGLSEDRKLQLANELRAQKGKPPIAQVATATAPAKTKPVVDATRRAVDLVGDYFDNPDAHVADVFGRLHDHPDRGPERFTESVVYLANEYKDFILRDVYGYEIGPRADDPEFQGISEDLRATAAQLAEREPSVWESLSLASLPEIEFHLRREAQLEEVRQAQQQEAESEHRETIARVQKEGNESLETISATHEKQIRESIKDLAPYDDKADNTAIQNLLLNVVFAEMMTDPEYQQVHNNIAHFLRLAPQLRAQGRDIDAQKCRMYGESLAKEFAEEFKSILSGYKNQLADVFANDKLYRESQRKDAPQEIQPFEQGEPIPGTRFFYPKRG